MQTVANRPGISAIVASNFRTDGDAEESDCLGSGHDMRRGLRPNFSMKNKEAAVASM